MNARTVAASVLACAVLVVVGKQLFHISWESALVLAPVFLFIAGAIAFLAVLWTKAIRDSLRERG